VEVKNSQKWGWIYWAGTEEGVTGKTKKKQTRLLSFIQGPRWWMLDNEKIFQGFGG